jgi:hypothetical protein
LNRYKFDKAKPWELTLIAQSYKKYRKESTLQVVGPLNDRVVLSGMLSFAEIELGFLDTREIVRNWKGRPCWLGPPLKIVLWDECPSLPLLIMISAIFL